MERWNTIAAQADIDALMDVYNGFHDSCLVRLDYRTGGRVDERNAMGFGGPREFQLRMVFHSQWAKPLELRFTGVRAFHIVGWQEQHFGDIFDCCLAIRTGLTPGRDNPIVIWADGDNFDPNSLQAQNLLDEGGYSWVAAQGLEWRWYTEETNQEEER